jgi:hypothetical protein
MKIQAYTLITLVHPNLGHVHNVWILYYSLCNHCMLSHFAYNRYVIISLSPYSLSTLQYKPLYANYPQKIRHGLSLIFIIFSHSLCEPLSSQPITYLYIESTAQKPNVLSQKPNYNSF